jgi:ribose transport system ATP-binding protein
VADLNEKIRGVIGMADTIIEFRNVDKRFAGVHAVKNVNFSIAKGEVHTIMGENGAGKSTLMNILSGMYLPDSGTIYFHGEPVRLSSPLVAKGKGISTVYQELKLCPNLNVVENIFLGREYGKGMQLDWKRMNEEARKKLDQLGLEIDVKAQVRLLSTAQMQLVEIAKAMFIQSEVLILDEPTSSLTVKETEKLFNIIEQLKSKGVAILFISHRMEEVFRISDRISIMRNGEYLGTYVKDAISPEKIVSLIAGKELVDYHYGVGRKKRRSFSSKDPVALEVCGLNRGKQVQDISFQLHVGEILGFYGLEGSGRTEVMETIYGLQKQEKGVVKVFGQEIKIKDTRTAINRKIAMLPEDRKHAGLFMNFDLKDNIASIHGRDILNFAGLMDGKRIRDIAHKYVNELNIKTFGISQMVRNLSGGNQQKVVIAKSLSIEPNILILDEPTRGVDVGAKAEIYKLLQVLRNEQQKSIVMVSSELNEIISESDRVLVMKGGRIVGELCDDAINTESILQLAFNG